MPRPVRTGFPRWLRAVGFGLLMLMGKPEFGFGQPTPDAPRPPGDLSPADGVKSIKPTPLVGFPDDPPPHEGAMIDIPLVLEPPDIVVVEVLEALPGRPITGERLVRPDGAISLGFYGDVHVRGLTPEQAKVKVIHHLRHYLSDTTLGLIESFHDESEGNMPSLPEGQKPVGEPAVPGDNAPTQPPATQPDKPSTTSPPKPDLARNARQTRRSNRRARRVKFVTPAAKPEQIPTEPLKPTVVEGAMNQVVVIDPVISTRVFVDLVAHNTKVYYVQGDAGTPGRLPFTGKETVLDAMNFAGGLIQTAEPSNIHLYRPARGDKPAKDYLIDFVAIQKGDVKANLQMFPNDRLVIGRNPIVKKTIEIDRATSALLSVFNNYSQLNRTIRAANPGAGVVNPVQLSGWFNILWDHLSDSNKVLNDPDEYRNQVNEWFRRMIPLK